MAITEMLGIGAFGALVGALLVAAIIFSIVSYVYFALVWSTIGKKLQYKNPWLAWIPIANIAMMLELGGFHWALVFLILVPFAGALAIVVLVTIATWRVFEKRNYPGWLALTPLAGFIPFIGILANIAYFVILGFVAWKDRN